ncbi:MAG: SDR family NAD(P)-dependent oxidoreductase [Pirellulaceae bacterium]
MHTSLEGKVALVTGGSRGIGAAVVRALAEEGAGVAIGYGASADKAQALVRELTAKGSRAAAFHADQADEQQVAQLVQQVVARFGRLDILVNNAGVFESGTLGDAAMDTAKLDRQLAVNLVAVYAAVRAAARVMGEGGRIISIGSVLGARVPFPGIADYSGTKAALVGYTKGWARDLGPKGITVNVVQPGPTNTEMNPDGTDFAAVQRSMTALGRFGRPEEVAAAVVFFASPAASFITGTTLDVDGGFSA